MSLRPAASLIICARTPPSRPGVFGTKAQSPFVVLLVKRNSAGPFRDLHVFPGGALDTDDDSAAWDAVCGGVAEGESREERRFKIAAVRETLEETGIALFDQQPTARQISEWRASLLARESKALFSTMVRESGLKPSLGKLKPWGHWITPAMEKKRFDTKFYLTYLDEEPRAAYADGRELVSAGWYTPQEALAAYDRGAIDFFPPQLCLLTDLSSVGTFPPQEPLFPANVTVQPEPVSNDEDRYLAFPGDRHHSTSSRSANGVNRAVYVANADGKVRFRLERGAGSVGASAAKARM
ncbi:hypothetical protein BJ742DRAFT_768678 [Cladochytrium replicatum]|nr:hypothetical protein BJ742DRAFT_768678 [Cladochytrium replicatum]